MWFSSLSWVIKFFWYNSYLFATHSSAPAWKIPWVEETGRLQSMGSLRVRHDWAISLSLFSFMHWRRKWQPTPVFLPAESQGLGTWWAAVYGIAQSRIWLKRLSSSSSSIGSVVKNLPANAGDLVSIQGPGRSHMLTGATKPMLQNYRACALESRGHNKRSHHKEKPMHWNNE